MHQDPAVPGFLGRALSFELSAVQQYLSLSSLLQMRGMPEASQHFGDEAREEMQHAERIIGRMLALGCAPSASQLRPALLQGSLTDLIQHTTGLEREIISLYTHAVKHCGLHQDHENRLFFEQLLQEEQQHVRRLETWRQQLMQGSINH